MLLLQELTGPNPQAIRLEGPALPERELNERIQLNTARTVYPGNPVASVQVLSTENKPVILKGLFSDRETGVIGFADAMRLALAGMARRGRRARLLYRNLDLEGILTRADFAEHNNFETSYELEFEVIATAFTSRIVTADQLATLQAEVLRRRLEDLKRKYDDVLEEFAAPPPGSLVTEEELLEPETIPPVEFTLDPWLEWRIRFEELQQRLRTLLEISGNETLINVDDAATATLRTAWVLTNVLRQGVEDWDGTGLGLLDQLTQVQLLYEIAASIDQLRLFLD